VTTKSGVYSSIYSFFAIRLRIADTLWIRPQKSSFSAPVSMCAGNILIASAVYIGGTQMREWRQAECLCIMLSIHGAWLRAQVAEPILTRSAMPLETGAGAIKLEYAGGIGRSGGATQAIPEATVEEGIRNGLELLQRFPLIRLTLPNGSTILGGGQIAIGARRLLAGGAARAYAISLQGVVEAPTGNTRLVGDATQVMPTVLADYHFLRNLASHANLTYDRSVGRTLSKASFLEYQTALVWRPGARFSPVVEFVGSTDTFRVRTQMITQPEIILRIGAHFEWKAGLQLGLVSTTPPVGIRIQLAAFWGRRD
jgi:hypothetical protein